MMQLMMIAWLILTPVTAVGGAVDTGAAALEPTTAQSVAETEPGPVVLARVNGEPIVREDIEHKLASLHGQTTGSEHVEMDLDRLVDKLVNDTLLSQEARALEIDREPQVTEALMRYRRELAEAELRRREIDSKSAPTDEQIRAAFQHFYRRASFHVLTSYDEPGAQALRAELEAGADIEALARERSVDPYALRGGVVKGLARKDLAVSVADALFELQPGEIGGPIRTDIGWSVVRLDAEEPADPERFSSVESFVAGVVRLQNRNELKAALGRRLREEIPVVVDDEEVARVAPKRLPDSRLIPETPDPDAVVVRVADETITAAEYGKALLDRWTGVRNEEAARVAAPIVLNGAIDDRLMLVEALRRGYDKLPAVERQVHALETELLVNRYLEEVLAAGIEITPDDKQAYYDAHLDSFRRPPRVHVKQLTVADRNEAESLAKTIREGGDIGWLASQRSIDRLKSSGGERGWMVPEPGVDAFNDALLAAKPGDVLDPTGAPGNWTVFQVTAKEQQDPYPFKQVSGNVREALFREKFRARLDEFLNTLRERSEIQINQDAVASLAVSGSHEATKGGGGHAEAMHDR